MKEADNHYEKCVLCGRQTETLVTLPVDARKNYIEGVGELCETCRRDLLMKKP